MAQQHPISVKLAVALAGEMLNLALYEDDVKAAQDEDQDDGEAEEADENALEMLQESTTVLRDCFLSLYPDMLPDPLGTYKWALKTFDHDGNDEQTQRAIVSLLLDAKEDLGDFRTADEKLPPMELQMYDMPEEQNAELNRRGRARLRGEQAVSALERLVHKGQRGVHRRQARRHSALAKIKNKVVDVFHDIKERPHYRVKIVKVEEE